MKIILFSLGLAFFCFIKGTHGVEFTDCGSTAKDLVVTVSGCTEDDDACPFVKGTNVSLSSTFKSGE